MSKLSLSARMILVLTLITVLSGGILAGWDLYTKPKVAFHREAALKAAITEVLPAYHHYDIMDSSLGPVYMARNEHGDELLGIAFVALGSGFQGELRIMVGLSPTLEQLTGIKVLEQIETPGLGTKIVSDPSHKANPFWFPSQFKGAATTPEMVVIKNTTPSKKHEIQGITGATISSKAVVRILNQSIGELKTELSRILEVTS